MAKISKPVFQWLQEEVKPWVDHRIKEKLKNHEYPDRIWYPISTGGKRWRPGLALLTGRLCGLDKDDDRLANIAAGIELLHNFTLVHDDVMDGDEYRRGQPSAWRKYGEASAINLGDMMFAKAITLFPERSKERALDTVVEITIGQQIDLDSEGQKDISIEEYMRMIKKKTGSLLDLSLEAPQLISDKNIKLEKYSLLGPAFQIRDDLLDFEEGKGREKIGNDVRAGKRTLMIIHADDQRVYDILDKPFEETTKEDIEKVKKILEDKGSIEFARNKMEELANEALGSLSSLPDTEEKKKLEELGEFLIKRQK